jgi:hypothetical protein
MISMKLKLWRSVGVAAALGLAACGGEAGEGGGGEGGEATQSGAPAAGGEAGESGEAGETGEAGARAAASGEGGEAGEAGAASAYAGVSGNQLTALRLQHLKGFVMAAARVVEENKPLEASVLVQQGLLEVYDGAPDQFGSLNVAIIRSAGEGGTLNRAQMMQRIRAANAEIDRAMGAVTDVDHAALTARMVDIATGLYQGVVHADYVDAVEYQHSMGAAYAARDALVQAQDELRQENVGAYSQAQSELSRFVNLWRSPEAPERPAAYADVLAQGSRVRLALSPYL